MRIAHDYKTAQLAGAIRWKIDDNLAGHTVPGRGYRKDYKRSNRHARRLLALGLRNAAAEA